ncbi:hypothetical protein MLD38_010205 [Melastoma candidum]|uniref:Uncharacterized protein n=1 Tax=Melastoma candidum TaxID=119954 RepID=A0ACB9QZ89_9MYRT|nr:hypothetical protein MLD38_010205 [Melastoma candidum]
MHMLSKEHNLTGGFAFIGEGIPVATGAAFTSKYRREVLKEADCDHVTLRDPAEKARYAARDPISALKKYMLENDLATEADLKAIKKKIDEVVEDVVEFADESPVPAKSPAIRERVC